MDTQVKEVMFYLLKNTEEYLDDYYVPTEKEMKGLREIYKDAPEDYLDFLGTFGYIGGALDIYGIKPGNGEVDYYLSGLREVENKKKWWNLENIILLRDIGNGDFDFIDLKESTNEKSAIYTFYHDDLTCKQLKHKSIFTYCLDKMLMFLEDDYADSGRYDVYEKLQEMLEEFEKE